METERFLGFLATSIMKPVSKILVLAAFLVSCSPVEKEMAPSDFGSPEKVWGQQEFNGENPQFRKR